MKAIILVGGEGTRLRPLTYHTPKQLLRVVGFPVLERVLGSLRRFGVEEAVLSLGYQPEAFIEAYPDGVAAGVRLSYAIEESPLDTAGAIRFAADVAGVNETFVVINGDILTDLDLGDLIDFHLASRCEATIGLVRVPDPSQFGVVVTDSDGRAVRFVEKPSSDSAPTNEINAGIYVLEPGVLERVKLGERMSIERELFPELVVDRALSARAYSCYWIDAGTPARFHQAVFDIVYGRRNPQPVPRSSRFPVPDHPGSTGGVCYLGERVEIARQATVMGSVLEDGVRVHPGATVVNSVILENAEIGPGASVVDSIVGALTRVPELVSIRDLSVVARSSSLSPGDYVVAGSLEG
ncbi:MAG: sugar phosphate nucleotidyltransferase [Ferrimicrobium sp.]